MLYILKEINVDEEGDDEMIDDLCGVVQELVGFVED